MLDEMISQIDWAVYIPNDHDPKSVFNTLNGAIGPLGSFDGSMAETVHRSVLHEALKVNPASNVPHLLVPVVLMDVGKFAILVQKCNKKNI